jgi:hypothetical protein
MRRPARRNTNANGQGVRTTPLLCPRPDANGPKHTRFGTKMHRTIEDALRVDNFLGHK